MTSENDTPITPDPPQPPGTPDPPDLDVDVKEIQRRAESDSQPADDQSRDDDPTPEPPS